MANKRSDCFKPFCGVEGRLCVDCAQSPEESPGAPFREFAEVLAAFGEAERPETVIDIVSRFDASARAVNLTATITTKTPARFMEALARHIPMVSAQSGAAERLFGIPIEPSEFMPPGRALLRTPCDCPHAVAMAEGGYLLHMAKRHCQIIIFDE